ncbi:UNVERIFIED_CONTAM: hypothetical protein GTU68_008172 [Idotea baltica]|nr:hypothetical protein [Idotea baltica]
MDWTIGPLPRQTISLPPTLSTPGKNCCLKSGRRADKLQPLNRNQLVQL